MRLCFCGVILWTQSRFRRVLRRFRSPRQKSARFACFCCGWCVARVCACLCTFVARVAFLILCPPRNAMSRDSAEYSDSFASHNAINRDSAVYSDSFASPQRNEPRVFLGVFVLLLWFGCWKSTAQPWNVFRRVRESVRSYRIRDMGRPALDWTLPDHDTRCVHSQHCELRKSAVLDLLDFQFRERIRIVCEPERIELLARIEQIQSVPERTP